MTSIKTNNFKKVSVPFFITNIKAGFPSPADDYIDRSIDLNDYLIQNPSSTFIIKVSGDSMIDSNINTGDLLIVDKSLNPKENDIIVACVNGQFTVKHYHVVDGTYYLVPSNKKYKAIQITQGMEFECWGIVTSIIHINRK